MGLIVLSAISPMSFDLESVLQGKENMEFLSLGTVLKVINL